MGRELGEPFARKRGRENIEIACDACQVCRAMPLPIVARNQHTALRVPEYAETLNAMWRAQVQSSVYLCAVMCKQ